jgi:opacity protein-like surface antigen
MVGVKSFVAAAAAAVISTAANAADMPMPAPPQIAYQPLPLVVEAPVGGWYLRGDIGVGIQSFSSFNFTQTNAAFVWPSSWTIIQQDIQDTTIFGLGVGYEVNNWFRVDFTGEYRTKAQFKVTGSYSGASCNGGVGTCFDVNTGNYSAEIFMVNAYFDLGTWWCLTPYIGFGVGGAYNTISGMQDNGIISNGTVGFGFAANNASNFNFAWNVQAGLTYSVNNNFKIDFNFRYLNLGSPISPIVECQNTTACPAAFYTFKDMTSEDFRIGFRWMLQPDGGFGVMPGAQPVFAPQPQYVPAPQPQYVPMQPQYVPAPQPQYLPAPLPPLQSRG